MRIVLSYDVDGVCVSIRAGEGTSEIFRVSGFLTATDAGEWARGYLKDLSDSAHERALAAQREIRSLLLHAEPRGKVS